MVSKIYTFEKSANHDRIHCGCFFSHPTGNQLDIRVLIVSTLFHSIFFFWFTCISSIRMGVSYAMLLKSSLIDSLSMFDDHSK